MVRRATRVFTRRTQLVDWCADEAIAARLDELGVDCGGGGCRDVVAQAAMADGAEWLGGVQPAEASGGAPWKGAPARPPADGGCLRAPSVRFHPFAIDQPSGDAADASHSVTSSSRVQAMCIPR